jgi:hypothetical protein
MLVQTASGLHKHGFESINRQRFMLFMSLLVASLKQMFGKHTYAFTMAIFRLQNASVVTKAEIDSFENQLGLPLASEVYQVRADTHDELCKTPALLHYDGLESINRLAIYAFLCPLV